MKTGILVTVGRELALNGKILHPTRLPRSVRVKDVTGRETLPGLPCGNLPLLPGYYGQTAINMTVNCMVTKFCDLDNLIITINLVLFIGTCPRAKILKLGPHCSTFA
ncbi:MAG: hypothetical protein JXR66_09355, partial [Bacteroidales bacterium]|nr:hypothetical protein [Bacteroidales bacterium]